MKKIINDPRSYVADCLAGFAAAHSDLVVADMDNRFCRRASSLRDHQVALVSGGGSGHEPLHAAFVGEGMLTAAVLGDVFASPTSDQVYEAGKAVASNGGVLFIVKNYTGDILNFRVATELMEDEGFNVATVVVAEDAALPVNDQGPGRRGTAGTLFVEKIAGAAAEEGADLATTTELARRVADQTRSIGVALTSCTTPSAGRPTFDLGDQEVEFGVGIHGERGRASQPLGTSKDLAHQLVGHLISDYGNDLRPDAELLVFTNGLGSTPESELYILHGDVLADLDRRGFRPMRHLVGDYVTSLDMAGASISIFPLDRETTRLWDAPAWTPALTRR